MNEIEFICTELFSGGWDESSLATQLLLDAGVDAVDLTTKDFIEAIKNSDEARWDELAWTCDEMLACYIADELTDEKLARSLIVIILLRRSAKRGKGDWEFSSGKVSEIMNLARLRISSTLFKHILLLLIS